MEELPLLHRSSGHVEWLTLNRPKKRNALDELLLKSLITCFERYQKEKSSKLVVIQGSGSSFSAGLDFSWVAEEIQSGSSNFTLLMSRLLELMNRYPGPIITLVKGWVCGGGVGIAACSDIVLASESTQFRLPEIKMGLVPAVISPYLLKLTAPKKLSRYYLTGDVMDVKYAASIGLVDILSKEEELSVNLARLIEDLLSCDKDALTAAKQLLGEKYTKDGGENEKLMAILYERAKSEVVQKNIKNFLSKKVTARGGGK